MEIELSDQIENSIIRSAEAGDYTSVARLLAEAILSERPVLRSSSRDRAVEQLQKNAFIRQSWQDFNRFQSAEEIADSQGVGPVKDADNMVFPSWPEGESVDDFIAAAKGMPAPVAE